MGIFLERLRVYVRKKNPWILGKHEIQYLIVLYFPFFRPKISVVNCRLSGKRPDAPLYTLPWNHLDGDEERICAGKKAGTEVYTQEFTVRAQWLLVGMLFLFFPSTVIELSAYADGLGYTLNLPRHRFGPSLHLATFGQINR
jgi:hypothetical protein